MLIQKPARAARTELAPARSELAPARSELAPSTVTPAGQIPPVRTRKAYNVQSKVAQARAALPFTRAKVWNEEVITF